MDIEQLRNKVSVTFKRSDNKECPICHNTVGIELRSNAEVNQFLGLIKHYNNEQAKKINKFQFFMNIRACFWSIFAMMCWFTMMTFFIKDNFSVLAFVTAMYGIIYILIAILYSIVQKIKAKKELNNEIESLINVEEPEDG